MPPRKNIGLVSDYVFWRGALYVRSGVHDYNADHKDWWRQTTELASNDRRLADSNSVGLPNVKASVRVRDSRLMMAKKYERAENALFLKVCV